MSRSREVRKYKEGHVNTHTFLLLSMDLLPPKESDSEEDEKEEEVEGEVGGETKV